MHNGRDDLGRLICQVRTEKREGGKIARWEPGSLGRPCKTKIDGLTGLQEIEKLRRHMWRVHGLSVSNMQCLDIRATWEKEA